MTSGRLEILAWESTPLGELCLRRRELASRPGTHVTEVTLDHEFLMSSYHTISEEALAAAGLDLVAGDGLEVIVGGLGLGYTARAALRSERVARVEVLELLPQVIDWLESDLIPLSSELKSEPRFSVRSGDVYAWLEGPSVERWDLILIDVDHSPDERLGDQGPAFYTKAGLRAAQAHLKPGGVLAVWSAEANASFVNALEAVFPLVRHEQVTFENDLIDQEQTDHVFLARRSEAV